MSDRQQTNGQQQQHRHVLLISKCFVDKLVVNKCWSTRDRKWIRLWKQCYFARSHHVAMLAQQSCDHVVSVYIDTSSSGHFVSFSLCFLCVLLLWSTNVLSLFLSRLRLSVRYITKPLLMGPVWCSTCLPLFVVVLMTSHTSCYACLWSLFMISFRKQFWFLALSTWSCALCRRKVWYVSVELVLSVFCVVGVRFVLLWNVCELEKHGCGC